VLVWLTGECVAELRRARAPSWLPAALLGATAVGVAAAVPDTEAALRVVGGLAAVGALALVAPLLRVPTAPPGAWMAAAATVVWAEAVGSAGRPAAFFGTLACYGAIVALPLAARLTPGAVAVGAWVWWPVVLAAHLPLVALGGRRTGLERAVGQALLPALAALAGLVAAFALVLLLRGWRRRRRADRLASA
jgi:hypothetical protein